MKKSLIMFFRNAEIPVNYTKVGKIKLIMILQKM